MKNKLKENNGSIYLYGACIILGLVIILSAFFEYFRIYATISTVEKAYEKAMLSVAIENYNEIFTSMRENTQIGGFFEGGNETIKDSTQKPIWTAFNDEGDISGELERLLFIDYASEDNELFKSDNFGNLSYILSNFSIQIRQCNYYTDALRYEIEGQFSIEMPAYFMGKEITRLKIDIPSRAAWKAKF